MARSTCPQVVAGYEGDGLALDYLLCVRSFDASGQTAHVCDIWPGPCADKNGTHARESYGSWRDPHDSVFTLYTFPCRTLCIITTSKHEHVRQEIEERGAGAIDLVRKAGGGCWTYGTKYTVGKILTLVASINVVVINFGLKASARELDRSSRS